MKKKILPWLAGAVLATLLFIGLAGICTLRYENSDDMLFVKGFMGFEGGKPVDFNLYTHTFLAWTLNTLSRAVPSVAWFSLFQLGLLWVSAAVTVKALVQLSGRKIWLGLTVGALYLGAFALFASARLSYTSTAAMAGAAAAAQLAACEKAETRRGRIGGTALAVLLLLGAYSLRQMTALPIGAYLGLVLCWRFFEGKNRRAVVVTAVSVAAVMLVFAGVREWEIEARGMRDTLKWQQARIELFDYTSFESNIEPALAADSGLTDEQVKLVQQWYFWDADITVEALTALREAYAGEETPGVVSKLTGFLTSNPRSVFALAALGVLLALSLLSGRRFSQLAALLAVLGGGVMLIYLCWRGRVLSRGLDTVFAPCAAVLMALAVHTAQHWLKKKTLAFLLCAALALSTGADAALTVQTLRKRPDTVSQQREADLERFALANPEWLIVRTPNLLRDTRLMPDVSAGKPVNTVIWGDWYCRMPGWQHQMAAYGLDGNTFCLEDWTTAPLLFATAGEEAPEVLLCGIEADIGREPSVELYGTEGTLSFYVIR